MRLLFDASAILNMVRALGSGALEYMKGGYVLDLTLYEIGNALWKEATLLRRISLDEVLVLLSSIENVIHRVMNVVSLRSKLLALELAHKLRVTYYDSSYIVAAKELRTSLVTDDERLRKRVLSERNMLIEVLGEDIKIYSTNEIAELLKRK